VADQRPARDLRLVLLALLVAWLTPQAATNSPIGLQASVGALEIRLQPPLELDHLSSAEILHLREEANWSATRHCLAEDTRLPARSFRWPTACPGGHRRAVLQWQRGAQRRRACRRIAFSSEPLSPGRAGVQRPEHLVCGARALAWDKARITTQDLADPRFSLLLPAYQPALVAARGSRRSDVRRLSLPAAMMTGPSIRSGPDASFRLGGLQRRDLVLGYLYWVTAGLRKTSR